MTAESSNIRNIRARRSRGENAWRLLKTAPISAWFGMIVILFYAFCAVFAPLIAPYGEAEIVGNAYEKASSAFWFGTDQIGRDILSRVIYGARNTIGIALLTVLLSFSIGGVLGVYAAITRGWFDQIMSRLVDALMSIPVLIFALMLLAVFGKYIINLIFILALLDSTRVFWRVIQPSMSIMVSSGGETTDEKLLDHPQGNRALCRAAAIPCASGVFLTSAHSPSRCRHRPPPRNKLDGGGNKTLITYGR
jgi:peptide/nickel transport system permease protein